MKNFCIVFLLVFCVVYCSGWEKEKEEVKQLQEHICSYQKIVRDYQKQERVVWKHAANLPDSFLQEFYPDAEKLDSLRRQLRAGHYGEDGI